MKKRYLIVVFIVMSLFIFQCFSLSIQPLIQVQARKEIERYLQLIINHVSFQEDVDYRQALNLTENKTMSYNMPYINDIIAQYVDEMEETMYLIEQGQYRSSGQSIYETRLQKISQDKGIVASIPIGLIFQNMWLAHLGPSINIRYQSMSIISSTIKKSIEDYGINHIAVSIDVDMKVQLYILTPFYKENYKKTFTVPLLFEIIEGEVPSWYQQ